MLRMVRCWNKNVPRPDRSDVVPAGTVPVSVLVLSLDSTIFIKYENNSNLPHCQ